MTWFLGKLNPTHPAARSHQRGCRGRTTGSRERSKRASGAFWTQSPPDSPCLSTYATSSCQRQLVEIHMDYQAPKAELYWGSEMAFYVGPRCLVHGILTCSFESKLDHHLKNTLQYDALLSKWSSKKEQTVQLMVFEGNYTECAQVRTWNESKKSPGFWCPELELCKRAQ